MAETKEFKISVKLVLSLLAVFVGIIFYISWGLTYGVWADIGIYSVTILFVALGILGLIFTRIK
ncbi:MAG: hypothetical protein DRN29_00985 [Thermoplasmata archaeon]|nr:MAG: hypothetical protein DRN29_00985 [Thermoplasmata archaeon]